jgi:hypothetical protein
VNYDSQSDSETERRRLPPFETLIDLLRLRAEETPEWIAASPKLLLRKLRKLRRLRKRKTFRN